MNEAKIALERVGLLFEEADKAFEMLAMAIKKEGISRKPGAPPDKNMDPDEFMYMQTAKGHHQFN